jgi:predicted DNA-binding protein (UPF0251 family)
MPRPCCPRRISTCPTATLFTPCGGEACDAGGAVLALDELEALRLADLEGMYQEAAAERMGISRSTFARIVEQARRKVADALVHGRTLRVGSSVETSVEMEDQHASDAATPPRCERTGCRAGKRRLSGCESHPGVVAERESGAVPRQASKKQEVIT